jgi:nucleotide-binding universal stress UspA family protein
MSETYIAGYDGSEASRAAVRFAGALAQVTGASMTIATVYDEPEFTFGRGGSAVISRQALVDQARHRAELTLDTLEDVDAAKCTVMANSTAHGLQRLSEDRHAALLAVGTTHRGPAGRLVPGSVAERLLQGAPCPVLVVPPGAGETPVRSITVAYDLRPEAQAALDHGVRLAEQLGARLTLVNIFEPSVAYPGAGAAVSAEDFEEDARRELEGLIREKTAGLPAAIDARVSVYAGPPSVILEQAARDGADLLVAGSRGYGPVRSVLMGSVSRHLVDHAPCPVLIVPRVASEQSGDTVVATAAESV